MCTLTAFVRMKELGLMQRMLVVAPLRVCYKVWPDEIQKWSHLRHLTHSLIHGEGADGKSIRRKRLGMPADIHIINSHGVPWLEKHLSHRARIPWDLIVIDESTQFKNWSAGRSTALRKLVKRIPKRLILTGTPAPRNLEDLFPQIWLLDEGKALGKDVTTFRENYCLSQVRKTQSNMSFTQRRVAPSMVPALFHHISPLCLRLDAKDYLSIPPISFHDVEIDLPAKARNIYQDLEDQLFTMLESGGQRDVINAAALYSICRQVASGGIYDNDKKPHTIHHEFDEAVVDLIDELQSKPLMIAYQFDHEAQRLKQKIKGLHVIHGGMNQKKFNEVIDAWNSGTLNPPYLAVQPKTLSFGVNMQYGECADIAWYGPTDCLDDYLQLNARIHRQGVDHPVRIHRLRAADTVHGTIWDKTDGKFDVQSNLLQVLREYAREKRHAS